MPRTAKFVPVKKSEGWCINIPASMTPDGRRVRRFFETRDDARVFAERTSVQYKNEGTFALGLNAEQRSAAARAFRMIEAAGLDDLTEVVRQGIDTIGSRNASRPLGEVFDRYLRARARSPVYQKSLKRSRKFWKEQEKTLVADLNTEIIETRLVGLAPSYRNSLLRELRAVLAFAVRRGWSRSNPVTNVDLAVVGVGEREVYTPEEAAALLNAAKESYPDYLPFVAIGLFSGIRVFEILRLRWADVHLADSMIDLPAIATKRKRRRSVPIEPVLKTWLRQAEAQIAPSPQNPLVPSPSYNALVRAAIRPLAEKAGVEWKQNAMRHSYASYWLAFHGDLSRLSLQLGHSGSLEILHRYYHRSVPKQESVRYWKLTPAIVSRILRRKSHHGLSAEPEVRKQLKGTRRDRRDSEKYILERASVKVAAEKLNTTEHGHQAD